MDEKKKTINELLDDLITDDTSDEVIKQIQEIKQATKQLETDRADAIEKAQNYRIKYINAIQNGDFGSTNPEEPEEKGPISIDDLIDEYSKKEAE